MNVDKIVKATELKFPFPVQTIRDTGWGYASTAIPSRGIHDYERFIQFERALSTDEESNFESQMKQKDNPGYCYWKMRRNGPGAYTLTTTCDSSD